MPEKLTSKQQQLVELIRNSLDKKGVSPSLSELMEAMHISTKRGVVNHLKALEKKGIIMRSSEARSIKLTENVYGQFILNVNILGYANAGTPMVYANEQIVGTLRVKKTLLPVTNDIFALEIKGDSMNKRLIQGTLLKNGNFAIVAKNIPINNGDVVLAIIDECATIKTFQKDKRVMVLYPDSTNKVHKPIYLSPEDHDMIYGKVIAVLDNPGR
ncbi:MAG: transcriptional repressor LexA [bacterium]